MYCVLLQTIPAYSKMAFILAVVISCISCIEMFEITEHVMYYKSTKSFNDVSALFDERCSQRIGD